MQHVPQLHTNVCGCRYAKTLTIAYRSDAAYQWTMCSRPYATGKSRWNVSHHMSHETLFRLVFSCNRLVDLNHGMCVVVAFSNQAAWRGVSQWWNFNIDVPLAASRCHACWRSLLVLAYLLCSLSASGNFRTLRTQIKICVAKALNYTILAGSPLGQWLVPFRHIR